MKSEDKNDRGFEKWEIKRLIEGLLQNNQELNFKHTFKKMKEYVVVVDGNIQVINENLKRKSRFMNSRKRLHQNLRENLK